MYSSWDELEYLSLAADLSWKAAGGERFREYGGWTVKTRFKSLSTVRKTV